MFELHRVLANITDMPKQNIHDTPDKLKGC